MSDSDGTNPAASAATASAASAAATGDASPAPAPTAESVAALLATAQDLRKRYVDTRIEWYRTHTAGPRFWFRWAGIVTILCSAALPALATAHFVHQEVVLSLVSIAIAGLTGLSSFYKWERTWRANSSAQIALEKALAKWELDLANAQCLPAAARADHVYRATSDLIVNSGNVVTAESEGFFSGLAFPQQNTTPKAQ